MTPDARTVDEERVNAIRKSAGEHAGRFLLHHRRGRPVHDDLKSEADRNWEAAEALVNRGEAIWISAGSSFYPGIQLKRL